MNSPKTLSCGLCHRWVHSVSPVAMLIAGMLLFPATARVALAADGGAGVLPAEPAIRPAPQESPVASLARLLDQLSESARELSRDGFDYQAVIESIGRDPAKLTKWVKENTRLVPYSGLLKGPQGVLMDRVGNDLDRIILLAKLVNSSGYECRLARAKLADNEAEALIASMALKPLPEIAGKPSDSYLTMNGEVDKQTQALMALVTPAIDFTKISQSLETARLADAKDHWWIQYKLAGKWIDLDPDSDGKPLSRLGQGKPVFFVCANNDLAGKIPVELFHTVTFKVMIERWNNGKLEEEPAVEAVFKTWEHPANHVYLYHRLDDKKARTAHPPQATALSELKEPAALKTALLNQHGWRPILVVNGSAKGPKSFDETGTLFAPEGGAAQMGNAVSGAFGSALNNGGTPKASQSVLTAEWVELSLARPGRAPIKIRREVFDSIGPAARAAAGNGPMPKPVYDEGQQIERAGALSGWTDHLVASCAFPWDYLKHQNTRRILDRRAAVLKAVGEPANPDNRALLQGVLAGDNLSLYSASRAMNSDRVTFQDQSNISSSSLRWRLGTDGAITANYAGDLAFNAVAATSSSSSEAYTETVRRGVADTCLEALIVGGLPYHFPTSQPTDAKVAEPPPSNTTEIFSLAARQGIQPILLRQATDPALIAMQVSDDVRQRIALDLAAGNVIVVPAKAVTASGAQRIGWWRIDAATGSTVGVMDTGGCGTAETSIEEGVVCEGTEDTVIFYRNTNGAKRWFDNATYMTRNIPKGTPEYSRIWRELYDICVAGR